MIIEYKLHISSAGMTTPEWVVDPGYFYNPENFSLVGIALNDSVREYYLPDSVYVLTRQTLIDRQLAINTLYPTDPPTPDSEVIAQVNAWCDARNEP